MTGRLDLSGLAIGPTVQGGWDAGRSTAIAGCVGTGTERISVMVRLRNAVMAVALGTGVMGCAFSQSQSHVAHYSIWHCDECDDFPMPAYGPGFSMMPGTYTRPPAQGSLDPKQSANGAADSDSVPPPQQLPASMPPSATPPTPPAASPGLGADARPPAAGGARLPNTIATRVESNLPPLPAGVRDELHVPVANP